MATLKASYSYAHRTQFSVLNRMIFVGEKSRFSFTISTEQKKCPAINKGLHAYSEELMKEPLVLSALYGLLHGVEFANFNCLQLHLTIRFY